MLLGSTCSELEGAGRGAAATLIGPGGEGPALSAPDGTSSSVAAGQCLAGQRLERVVRVEPATCAYVELLGLPPIERIEVEVEASAAAALPGATWSVECSDGTTRLPPAGCLAAHRDRPVVVRLAATVAVGGGVVAMRVASAPAR